ncbi:hypothetical protein Z042_24900 [Chania multitudinisentens RB-25]|uniref:Fimbrial-type adhesion domain-containing protein n=1 Tax=Chania multitudinisentens RB-25 TaxID=1441930 RepID=W0LKI1_9GAMM|nr:hypothetical protein Z042_24900 [Chania multitudinisentens RB-25]
MVALLSTAVQAASGIIDGTQGVLRVTGTLTESACRLEMNSADQSVRLGDVGTGRLQQMGDYGTPVAVLLHLQDCIRSSSSNSDRQGNLTWGESQPAVSLTFSGLQDDSNPQLFLAQGVSGMGLRLTDAQNHNVMPGVAGRPQLLTPGSNVLTYYIMPERTGARLQAGTYLAYINFRLSYE